LLHNQKLDRNNVELRRSSFRSGRICHKELMFKVILTVRTSRVEKSTLDDIEIATAIHALQTLLTFTFRALL